jgi:hypothetical protein
MIFFLKHLEPVILSGVGSDDMISEAEKEIKAAFYQNAAKEMKEKARRAASYAENLENTDLDIEQEALVENFSREFNHDFSEIRIQK